MEIYGSLEISKMVAKVVKNNNISNLSSIILIKLKNNWKISEKWTILFIHILWEQKAKKNKKKQQKKQKTYVTRESFSSSSMPNAMAVWAAVSSSINFFFGVSYIDLLRFTGLSSQALCKTYWPYEIPFPHKLIFSLGVHIRTSWDPKG